MAGAHCKTWKKVNPDTSCPKRDGQCKTTLFCCYMKEVTKSAKKCDLRGPTYKVNSVVAIQKNIAN
jgi:hypothetical protein